MATHIERLSVKRPPLTLALLALVALLVAAGCGGSGRDSSSSSEGTSAGSDLSGTIEADGSSTVGPLAQVAAEKFAGANSGVTVNVGVSGTGGGFQRFCKGETDLSNASRPIKDEEAKACKDAGVAYHELIVANDGIALVGNKDNSWAKCLTVAQLAKIWGPDSKAKSWKEIDASFPDESLTLYGPGTDSGTFDFFTGKINGEEGASRTDYSATEDDNVTVSGVEGDKGALGYFGLSYAEANIDKLTLIQVDGGAGCVTPTGATVQNGTYTPLSRPLYVYVKDESAKRPEVKAFLKYWIDNAESFAKEAKFVPLTTAQLTTAASELKAATGEGA